eukprot:CAMPEP_0167800518 /NCGR_PEP_ID=MMETSP0111_2-20121227/17781_1 /TAXON_ID=91324 /ORGANISM="Lotharella globosa, Strain CCCM811" /LENGTH=319 /DNA_ID=CAMNT_0007695797 /DNA_START=34 /DNA_END=990 /DNA_ORIENTATION=-
MAQDCAQPLLDITSTKTLRWCRTLKAAEKKGVKDLFICSYPKSGTTWLQHICLSLIAGKDHTGHVSELAPFYEADATWDEHGHVTSDVAIRHDKIRWRVFNTHLWWELLPKHHQARYIYVVRDGRDAAVSFYHHLSHQLRKDGSDVVFKGTYAQFHALWVEGKIAYGRWVDHIRSYHAARGHKFVVFVRYEDIKNNLSGTVHKLNAFLGTDLSADSIESLLPTFRFQWMKANISRFQPLSVQWAGNFKFIRKGEIGDHKATEGPAEARAFFATLHNAFPGGVPKWAGEYKQQRDGARRLSFPPSARHAARFVVAFAAAM